MSANVPDKKVPLVPVSASEGSNAVEDERKKTSEIRTKTKTIASGKDVRDTTYEGYPYLVVDQVPAVPTLVRCPRCHHTERTYIDTGSPFKITWLVCCPGLVRAPGYFHYCSNCRKPIQRIDDIHTEGNEGSSE